MSYEKQKNEIASLYRITEEDKNVLNANPEGAISGCYDDVKEGHNKDKCKQFISYLKGRCTSYSNAFPYCRSAESSIEMFLIEMK